MPREDIVDVHLESSEVSTPGVDVFRVEGRETLGELFHFAIDVAVIPPAVLHADEWLGARVTLVFAPSGGAELRRVSGMIHKVEQRLDLQVDHSVFRLHLVPRAWRLTTVETQEIFLNMTVPDIIRNKLERVGLSSADDLELRLTGQYPVCEFVTQYKESDLAFVSRLAEHLGITMLFEQGPNGDRIVFSDHQAGLPEIAGAALRPRGDAREIYRLDVATQLIPASYAVHDYNYRTPLVDLISSHVLTTGYAGGVIEDGGHFKTLSEGEQLARVRAEAREATRVVLDGDSDLPQLFAGARLKLGGDHRLPDPMLLVTELSHVATRPVVLHDSRTERHYQNTFRAVPGAATYRPQRRTPRPRIHGLVTGIIEHGVEQGTERWAKIDEWGRYSIRFLFDTADHPQKQSRWCRMLQPHAGTNYGMHFPLKPGIEVAIAFIDGDPDRPIIVGSVPNPMTPSPVTVANHTVNKLKTESGCIIEIRDA
jgi:type VI secretion system secreted protein VgrG